MSAPHGETTWRAFTVTNPAPIRLTLPIGEAARRALMSVVRRHVASDDEMPAQLIGRRRGAPASGHSHLRFLPCDLDGDSQIDTILIAAIGPFHSAVLAGLAELQRVRVNRALELALAPTEVPAQLLTPSSTFASTTPYVCPRYPKLKRGMPQRDASGVWQHGPEQQLRYLLEQNHHPTMLPLSAEDVRFGVWADGRLTPWHEFVIERRHGGGRRGLPHGFGWRLTFSRPIQGPLSSGYASHFGLGQFHPV